MSILQKILLGIATVGGLVAVITFPVESHYAGKAVLTQRVLPSAEASIFGDVGEKVGTPQKLIIDDQQAFLVGNGESGIRLVNETYLRAKGIYPLQMQTVSFVVGNTRLVATLTSVVFLGIFWVVRKRAKSD